MDYLLKNADELHQVSHVDLLDAAWEYCDMAFHLIPLSGKKPAKHLLPCIDGRPSWKPLLERRNSREEILRWFGRDRANIGILTGVSGVVVIDCDRAADAEWWCGRFSATPMITKTARGIHLFYRFELGIKMGNRTSLFDRKIDLRGQGGYVVAPPSLHPNGTRYERMGTWNLCDVPEFERHWIPANELPATSATAELSNVDRLRRYVFKIRSISGERGHDSCFRAACKIADAGIDFERGMEVFREWNELCAVPMWTEKELRHKLTDAFQKDN